MDTKHDEALFKILIEFGMCFVMQHELNKNCTKLTEEFITQINDLFNKKKIEYLGNGKWTCEHEKNDELASDCAACHIAWCEERIKVLEKKSEVVLDEGKIFTIMQNYMRKNQCCIDWGYVKELAQRIAQAAKEIVK